MDAIMQPRADRLLRVVSLIDCNVRPRLAIGNLCLEFIVMGDWIASLKPRVQDDDPRWEALVRGGVRSLLQLPSVPFKMDSESTDTARE